jgi:hypothetical protein
MLGIAVREARRGQRPVEIRLGVGPLQGDLPLRVLGHASLIARVIRTDIQRIAEPASITIFSSEPKAGRYGSVPALCAVTVMAMALRLAGIDTPIHLDAASANPEVPIRFLNDLPPELARWLYRAQALSRSSSEAAQYAAEHAGPSMFADLCDAAHTPLRITIGGTPEGRFWAARRCVRAAAAADGWPVAPAMAFIMKAIRVPWYHPEVSEPALVHTRIDDHAIDTTRELLCSAANPALGGNSGLMAEMKATVRALRAMAREPGGGLEALTGRSWSDVTAAAVRPDLATGLALSMGCVIGDALTSEMSR